MKFGDHVLHHEAARVTDITADISALVHDMIETMYAAPGVGLAAIQVGWDKSLLVYDIAPRDDRRELHVLINPRIVASEGEMISENEGCLSVPDYRADVKRAERILVDGVDRPFHLDLYLAAMGQAPEASGSATALRASGIALSRRPTPKSRSSLQEIGFQDVLIVWNPDLASRYRDGAYRA